MRNFFLSCVALSVAACGSEAASSGTGTDATASDAAGDISTSDGSGDTSADATTDDSAGSDTTAGDVITSDSEWQGKLFLNEIQAGGSKTPDVATDADWIEIYNATDKEVELANCKVGGINNGIAGSHMLPAGTKIAAKGFLVVYYNHANLGVPVFDAGIKSDGSMALWDAKDMLIDSIDWNEGDSPAGSTYDRVPDGAATWKIATPPTPGAPNSK